MLPEGSIWGYTLIKRTDKFTCWIESNTGWSIYSRRRGSSSITAETVSPDAGDGGDNPCGDRYLADTMVKCISNINVI